MNRKSIISLGLVIALSATIAAYADTTIYTDGIGRMHFLGRDAANNIKSGSNYSNSVHQDLTRKLYEQAESGVVEDTTFDQHPLKNYENTFPDSRFNTAKYWQPKPSDAEESGVVKSTVTAAKGQTDYSGTYQYGSTILDNPNAKEVKTSAKKHWWQKK